jgi:aspartyl-tRNA(Asn)/glutamyl-tRNA(Gln) amidotransferase subunit C
MRQTYKKGHWVKLTQQEVEAVAELAKLELTADEITLYTEQLSAILDYIDKLNEVDTSNIPPTASVLPIQNVLRPDKAGATLSPQDVVANASDAQDNQFKVSAVLDQS